MKYDYLVPASLLLAALIGGCEIKTTSDEDDEDEPKKGNETGGAPAASGGSASNPSTGNVAGTSTPTTTAGSGNASASGGSSGIGGRSSAGAGGGAVDRPPLSGGFVPPSCGTDDSLPAIEQDTTLEAGKCYRVEGRVHVTATLTLKPGVVLNFGDEADLVIEDEGAIVAVGTAAAPITFMGKIAEPGYWGALAILSNNPKNELAFVQFAHGGAKAYCCEVGREATMVLIGEKGRATIRDSLFTRSGANGLDIEPAATVVAFERNAFIGNQGAPLRIASNLVGRIDGASDYAGKTDEPHGDPFIEVRGTSVATSTWPKTNAPFRVRERLTADAVKLTLAAGAAIEFDSGAGLAIGKDATLIAAGTQADPIVLRGSRDEPGVWRGVLIESPDSANRMSFVRINGGGEDEFCCEVGRVAAGLVLDNDAQLTLEDSVLRKSKTYGMQVRSTSKLEFTRNRFEATDGTPLLIAASNLTKLDSASVFKGMNKTERVEVVGDTASEAGTWPSIDVPYLIDADVTIVAAIEIAAKNQLIFAEGVGLWVAVEGSLRASSTAKDIRFEGLGNAAGFWNGIGFESNSAQNVLDGVTIDGAGYDGWCCEVGRDAAAVLVEPNSQVTVKNSTISRSGGWAIFSRGTGMASAEKNTYQENELGEVGKP